ncbi:MAG: PIN domain-containing protein [Candidatus Lokiarchaeota archaeon]|nr:PIN domain-containing protein [Candidatus Lokiarchaeota archaeon]
MIFLDSDAIIAILRGKPNMAAFLAEHAKSIFAIAIIVLYEIYYGFYFPPLSKRFQKDLTFLNRLKQEEQRMVQFLSDIQVYDLTIPAIKRSAELSASLDSKGMNIGKMDILIAGIILANGHHEIVTNNITHYENVPGLKIHSY